MFPPNRLETAKYISQMLGETTVVERQFSVSGKRAASEAPPEMTPEEIHDATAAVTESAG